MREERLVTTSGAHPEEGIWEALLARLREMPSLTVAYSGGVDSRFLVHAALRAGATMELLHVTGPHVAVTDTEYALEWAREQGLPVRILALDPLDLPEVAGGERERCYACKSFLFRSLMAVARGVVCDGSNASDASEFRPGRRALLELGVRSPLAEAGLTKEMIRNLARRTGMSRPGQQSRACLLTRLPYGIPPRPEVLGQVAEGERMVEAVLLAQGDAERPFRLRLCDTGKWELHLAGAAPSEELLQELDHGLRTAGFEAVSVRTMPALSGYFDRMQKMNDA